MTVGPYSKRAYRRDIQERHTSATLPFQTLESVSDFKIALAILKGNQWKQIAVEIVILLLSQTSLMK